MPNEQPRPVANSDEHNYTLTIEETADRYAQAGVPRTHRAIQKYCAASKLDCRKTETEFGEKYLIAPYSIERHIAYIKSVMPTVEAANGREETRTDATVPPPISEPEQSRTDAANTNEQPRPAANVPEAEERYIRALERENEFLRGQIKTKDDQIKDYADRSRETNILMQSFQRLLNPLLGNGDRAQADPPPIKQGRDIPPNHDIR